MMVRKRPYFPSSREPTAFMRLKAIDGERVDRITTALRQSDSALDKEALQLINDFAAHWVSAVDELGQLYEEKEKHAA